MMQRPSPLILIIDDEESIRDGCRQALEKSGYAVLDAGEGDEGIKIARDAKPDIALIDELAHTNVPGSKHEKRWQDVEEILDHGITVISTLNVQHIESLADVVESITGTKVRERIPDHLVDKADELELVDMAPHALRQRISHGNVYPPERAGQALRQFFREGNLNALRELALRKVSTTVEEDLEAYMRRHEISTVWPAAERVMVAVDQHEAGKRLIRRGWRLAHRLQAEMTVVFIETPEWERATEDEKKSLEDNLRFATDLGAEVVRRPGTDVALELSKVAHEQNAGSVVMGRPSQRAFRGLLRGSIADRLIRLAPDIDVIIVAKQES